MMNLSFGSLFTGIGGFDLGLERAGWECRWQVELDPWRRQVLARHWPDVPRWADVRDFRYPNKVGVGSGLLKQGRSDYRRDLGVDLICGGFPCQDLSVAGKRAGLAGERSGLFFEFARIAQTFRPTWLLIENVPGLLTSRKGHDFAVIVDTLADIGYGLAWRILDSQYFGVPQRRRRVYIVGHLGAPCPPEILFEPEGGGGDTPAGGKAGQGVAHALRSSPRGVDEHTDTTYILQDPKAGRGGKTTEGIGIRAEGPMYTLEKHGPHGIAQPRWGGSDSYGDEGTVILESRSRGGEPRTFDKPNLRAYYGDGKGGQRVPYVGAPPDADGVREATELPRWLDPDVRTPDGRRYAALGDAVTVNVIEWIGWRLAAAENDGARQEA